MDAPSPLITVIMPAFNSEDTIGAAITGVLTQTYPSVELIVIDDGSTDRTGAICTAFGDRLTYLRVENGGSAKARNHGLRAAHGAFIAFCDADDMLLPSHLQAAFDCWLQGGRGRRIVTCDALLLTASGLSHGRRLLAGTACPPDDRQRLAALEKNFVAILALFPRALLDEVGLFDETLRYREDWELWLRAILGGWRVVYQSTPHALYRWSATAKTTHRAGYDVESEILTRIRADQADLSAEERAFLDLRLSHDSPRLIAAQAEDALRAGDLPKARELYAVVACLSVQDRRTRLKARAIAEVPLLATVWAKRLRRIDRTLGRTGAGIR